MERKNRDQLVGSIFKGRIKNLEPSLQAAFVDIGCGKNAFLHYWDMLPATQDMLEDGQGDDVENDNDTQKPVVPSPLNSLPTTPQVQNTTHSRKRSKHHRNETQQLQAAQQQQPAKEPPKKGFLARILDFFARRRNPEVTKPVAALQPASSQTEEPSQKAPKINNTTQSGKNR
ncbi:MAG: hypothetical protein J6T06_05350, partial [Victivallales bacterium]|nr:hypothetical protein [Victivallales bacterium]